MDNGAGMAVDCRPGVVLQASHLPVRDLILDRHAQGAGGVMGFLAQNLLGSSRDFGILST